MLKKDGKEIEINKMKDNAFFMCCLFVDQMLMNKLYCRFHKMEEKVFGCVFLNLHKNLVKYKSFN